MVVSIQRKQTLNYQYLFQDQYFAIGYSQQTSGFELLDVTIQLIVTHMTLGFIYSYFFMLTMITKCYGSETADST